MNMSGSWECPDAKWPEVIPPSSFEHVGNPRNFRKKSNSNTSNFKWFQKRETTNIFLFTAPTRYLPPVLINDLLKYF